MIARAMAATSRPARYAAVGPARGQVCIQREGSAGNIVPSGAGVFIALLVLAVVVELVEVRRAL